MSASFQSTLTPLREAFRSAAGSPPAGFWQAPGRVNLIGEHTDYNDGYVLPIALAQRTVVAADVRPTGDWLVTSVELRETHLVTPDELTPGKHGWVGYIVGVVWALRQHGYEVGGASITLSSNVPLGAGLSSSAALECATLAALCDLYQLDIPPLERAKIARFAENAFVGAPTGLLDQAASTLCRADEALFLDCRTLDYSHIPFDLEAAGLELLVLDTKTPHSHVTGEYAQRRSACEHAAKMLGVRALRDVTDLADALARLDDQELVRRTRHVVTENERVLKALEVAESGDLVQLGNLFDSSHASMRDDYEITVPTVDTAVETARLNGAIGARMTGGGFGGCIIALTPAGEANTIGASVAGAFANAGYAAPEWFTARASQGAGRIG